MRSLTTNPAGKGVVLTAALALAFPVVKGLEGIAFDPYYDIAHVQTVCYGETHAPMRRYSLAECDAMLGASLKKYGYAVQKCLPATVSVPVLAAFVSFSYNIGIDAACGSTAARLVRSGQLSQGCQAMGLWTKITHPATRKKVVSNGLVKRRGKEIRLCLTGV